MNKYVLLACLFASSAFAQDSPWQFTGGVLLSEGGDHLFTGKYTDGTKIDITAGGTLGTNGNASFTRFPLEVMGFYQLNDEYRIGACARKSLSAKLKTSGVAKYQDNAEFHASVGNVIELQYLFFTEKTDGYKVKGDHIGVGVVFYN
jgi:hypothetical protein